MSASSSDGLTHVGIPGTATTMSSPGHTIGGTAITVGSTTNWPTDTGVIFAMDTYTLTNGVQVRNVGTYSEWEGVVTDSETISSLVLREGSDQNYPAGTTTRVYIPVTSSRENRLVDTLLAAGITQGGGMGAITPTSVTTSGAVLTSPKIITSVNDTNGNEEFTLTAVTSAVNQVDISNTATGNGPIIASKGNDTNIDLNLNSKGTGIVKVNGNPINAGAFTVWTPTWTNLTVGNGTNNSTYTQIGKTVTCKLYFILGSTSSISGAVTFTPPVTTSSNYEIDGYLGIARLTQPAVATAVGLVGWKTTTSLSLLAMNAASTYATESGLSSSVPFSWATTGIIFATFTYEAA